MKRNELYLHLAIATAFILICMFCPVATGLPVGSTVTQAWLPIASLGVSVFGTALQGIGQRRRARELEAQNPRPVFTPSAELRTNQILAQQQRQGGLPDEVYNNNLNQIQQGLSTGLRSINQRGNASTNANVMLSTLNRALGNLNAQDAQARQVGTQSLMNANRAVADEERYAYQQDMNAYQQTRQDIASTRRAGTQNLFGALGLLGQGSMAGVFGGNGLGTLPTGMGTTATSGGFMNNPLYTSRTGMFG